MSIIASAAFAGLTKKTSSGGGGVIVDTAADYQGTMLYRWRSANNAYAHNADVASVLSAVGGVNLEQPFGANYPKFQANRLNGFGSFKHTALQFLRTAAIPPAVSTLSILLVAKMTNAEDSYITTLGNDNHAIVQGFGSGNVRYFDTPAQENMGARSLTEFKVYASLAARSVAANRWHWGCTQDGAAASNFEWVDFLVFEALTLSQFTANIAQSKLQYALT